MLARWPFQVSYDEDSAWSGATGTVLFHFGDKFHVERRKNATDGRRGIEKVAGERAVAQTGERVRKGGKGMRYRGRR